MTPYKSTAHIASLDGAIDEITVLDKRMDADGVYYIVDYKGTKCRGIMNHFVGLYYVDDIYTKIEEN